MAQSDLSTIAEITKNNPKVQGKAKFTYSSYDLDDKHYLQIDMYGGKDRKKKNQVSQAIQLDKDTAKYLYNLLQKEFNFT